MRYRHMDMAHLDEQLTAAKDARIKLVATDGVFSMDGDVAPLKEIVALARKHGAQVFVDECHATGVLGATGRGTDELCGVLGQVRLSSCWLRLCMPSLHCATLHAVLQAVMPTHLCRLCTLSYDNCCLRTLVLAARSIHFVQAQACLPALAGGHHQLHAWQGAGWRHGGLHHGPRRRRCTAAPEEPAVPVQQHARARGGRGIADRV
jgi:Aminotransferase class I and II